MSDDRRCGTCRLWSQEYRAAVGKCTAPVPDCVKGVTKYSMRSREGATCPMWKGRPTEYFDFAD